MIKYFFRKTIYKNVDHESQDMILQLIARHDIIQLLCYLFWAVFYILPFIPLFIINVFEDIELSIITQIAILAFEIIFLCIIIVSLRIFKTAMLGFSELLAYTF